MDGLTNIIAKIHIENELECASVLSEAKQKADAILGEARIEAKRVTEEIMSSVDAQVKLVNSRAVSSSQAEYKRAVLSAKSRLIDEALENAVKSIINSPVEVYFGYIEGLVVRNALSGRGIVSMSQRDIDRMPDGFEEKLNKALGDGKSVEFAKEAADFDGGFVIDYPEMRVDCTLESLIADKLDEIRDELSNILFA